MRGRVLPPKKSRDMAVFKGESFFFLSDKDIDGQSLLGLVETGASQITEQIIPNVGHRLKILRTIHILAGIRKTPACKLLYVKIVSTCEMDLKDHGHI